MSFFYYPVSYSLRISCMYTMHYDHFHQLPPDFTQKVFLPTSCFFVIMFLITHSIQFVIPTFSWGIHWCGGHTIVAPLKIGCPSHPPSANSSSARVGFMNPSLIHAVNSERLNLVQILPIIMARVNFRSLMIWLFRSQKCHKWYCHLFCVCAYACMQTHMCACTQVRS